MAEYIVAIDVTRAQFPADASIQISRSSLFTSMCAFLRVFSSGPLPFRLVCACRSIVCVLFPFLCSPLLVCAPSVLFSSPAQSTLTYRAVRSSCFRLSSPHTHASLLPIPTFRIYSLYFVSVPPRFPPQPLPFMGSSRTLLLLPRSLFSRVSHILNFL